MIRRLIQLFTKIAEEDSDKFAEIQKAYRTILKLGAAEDEKHREKIAALVRFDTNQRNSTSLDNVSVIQTLPGSVLSSLQYLSNKKLGQKQVSRLEQASADSQLISADLLSCRHGKTYHPAFR